MLKNKKIVENKLKALYNSSFPKFAFVPEKAYSDGKSSVKGLVVDLQDVIQFDIKVKVYGLRLLQLWQQLSFL